MNVKLGWSSWVVVGAAMTLVAGCGGSSGTVEPSSTPPATSTPASSGSGGTDGGAADGGSTGSPADGGTSGGGSTGGQAGGGADGGSGTTGGSGGSGSGGATGSDGGATGSGGGATGGGSGGSDGGGGTGGVNIKCPSSDAPVVAGGLTFRHETLPTAPSLYNADPHWFASDAQHLWVTFSGHLLRSSGDGCWKETTPAGAGSVTAVGGADAQNLVLMTTSNQVANAYRSTDGGATWSSHAIAGAAEIDSIAFAGTTAYAGPYTAGNDWDLAVSSDGYATATTAAAPLTGSWLYYAGALFDWGATLTNTTGVVNRSVDGGTTWTQAKLCSSPFNGGLNGLSGAASSLWALCYVEGKYHSASFVYHSTDNGVTWTNVTPATMQLEQSSGTSNLYAAGSSIWLAAPHVLASTQTSETIGEYVEYSTDGGATFQYLTLPGGGETGPAAVAGSSADDVLLVMPDATVWHGRKE